MNGVPVYPVRQNGERPYPEPRKVGFSTPLFGPLPRLPDHPANLKLILFSILLFPGCSLVNLCSVGIFSLEK